MTSSTTSAAGIPIGRGGEEVFRCLGRHLKILVAHCKRNIPAILCHHMLDLMAFPGLWCHDSNINHTLSFSSVTIMMLYFMHTVLCALYWNPPVTCGVHGHVQTITLSAHG